ncbi:MAG: hypothetical protein IPH78_03635 [Bacteroidetes bacterium]|nr:hypothetical protein [Bacteroidota bacterium]
MKHGSAFLTLMALLSMSSGCSHKQACKKYVGTYSDRGTPLHIVLEKDKYLLREGSQTFPCHCTEAGLLQIEGPQGKVTILLSDSAGRKRFCFEEDSLHEDCLYEMKE